MGGLGSLSCFLEKLYMKSTKNAIKMQYIGGGSMKISNILCISLCIYDSQVPATAKRGGGVIYSGEIQTQYVVVKDHSRNTRCCV